MLRRFSLDFAIFSFVLDTALIALALGLATSLRPALNSATLCQIHSRSSHTSKNLIPLRSHSVDADLVLFFRL